MTSQEDFIEFFKEGNLEKIKDVFSRKEYSVYSEIESEVEYFGHFDCLLTPLKISTIFNHINLIKYFFEEEKMDIDHEDSNGETCLSIACCYGRINIVKYLIEKGANLNLRDSWLSCPIFDAIENKHEDISRELISNGCDINILSGHDFTVITEYVLSAKPKNINLDFIKYMLDMGANPHLDGCKFMIYLSENQKIEISEYIENSTPNFIKPCKG